MGLPIVSTSNEWIASAEGAKYKSSTDTHRYKDNVNIGTPVDGKPYSSNPTIDANTESMIDAMMNSLHGSFAGISSSNKAEVYDMILDHVNTTSSRGSDINSMASMKNSMSTICGNFDSGLFGANGGFNPLLFSFGLASLLASLLCMGVVGVLSAVYDLAKLALPTTNILPGIVDKSLTALGVPDGIDNKSIGGISTAVSRGNPAVSSMVKDIVANPDLSASLKNTGAANKLVNNYSGDDAHTVASLILPNYKMQDISTTKNIGNSINKSLIGTPVGIADTTTIKPLTMNDYLMLV